MAKSNNNKWTFGALLALASLVTASAHANSIAADALTDARAATTFFGGGCFGVSNLFVADVAASGNNETVVLNVARKLTDTNNDGKYVLRQVMTVVAYGANNQIVWQSAPIVVNSRDMLNVVPGQIVGYNPDFFNIGTFGRFFQYFPIAGECAGLTIAVHGGKTYVVVVGGFSAAEGNDPLTGSDNSSAQITVLDGDTGSLVRAHKITRQNKRYLSPFFNWLIDYNDDGNIDIAEWRVRPFTENRVTATVRIVDLVSGAELAFFSFPIASSAKVD